MLCFNVRAEERGSLVFDCGTALTKGANTCRNLRTTTQKSSLSRRTVSMWRSINTFATESNAAAHGGLSTGPKKRKSTAEPNQLRPWPHLGTGCMLLCYTSWNNQLWASNAEKHWASSTGIMTFRPARGLSWIVIHGELSPVNSFSLVAQAEHDLHKNPVFSSEGGDHQHSRMSAFVFVRLKWSLKDRCCHSPRQDELWARFLAGMQSIVNHQHFPPSSYEMVCISALVWVCPLHFWRLRIRQMRR